MSADNTAAPRLNIDFYLDVICPWCWIGLRNLRTALQELRRQQPELELRLTWHADTLLPHIPDEGVDFQAFYLARRGDSRHAVVARRAQINAVAQSVGLQIDFDAIQIFPNSRLVCALINLAQTSLTPDGMFDLVESLFDAHFVQCRNIGQPEVVQSLALAAGLPWDAAHLAAQPPGRRPPAGGVPHVEFNREQVLTGAVPAADLLQAMTQAVATAPRQAVY